MSPKRWYACYITRRHFWKYGSLNIKLRKKLEFDTLFMVKVKFSHYRPDVAQSVGGGIALLFHDRGTRNGWVVSSTAQPHFTPGKTRYPFYRRLGGPQGRSGWAENLVPTEIRSRTFQPVVSRYTDRATRSTLYLWFYEMQGMNYKDTAYLLTRASWSTCNLFRLPLLSLLLSQNSSYKLDRKTLKLMNWILLIWLIKRTGKEGRNSD